MKNRFVGGISLAGRLGLEPYMDKPCLTVLLYFQNQFRRDSCARKSDKSDTFYQLLKCDTEV